MTSETMIALLDTLRTFWPDGEPAIARRRETPPRGSPSFVVVPHARAPRLLVPADSSAAAAASMRRFSSALNVKETLQRLAVSLPLRLGAGAVFPDRVVVRVGSDADSLRAYLSAALGQPVIFSFGIGNPRGNRKPVLQIFSTAGRSLGFAKIGATELSIAHVRGEARALAALAGATWQHLQVPQVLHEGTWNDAFVLVMSALPASPFQRPSRRAVPPVEAMDELARGFLDEPRALEETELWQRVTAIGERLRDEAARATFLDLAVDIRRRAQDRAWTTGAWHGDWAPWNMARSRGAVLLWDWERFERGVPLGFDHYHYVVNERVRRHGVHSAVIGEAVQSVAMSNHHHLPADRLPGALYLLAATGRYLSGAEEVGGASVKPRAIETMVALDKWLRA